MNNNTFEYTYSAKQQEEVAAIRKKYVPAEEDKMVTLRKLDRGVENRGEGQRKCRGALRWGQRE